MPRINEHTFELDNSKYKLTYYRQDKPLLYRNGILFSGNKSALLKEYIIQTELPLNLFKGQTTQQLSDLILNHFSEGNNKKIVDKTSSNQSEYSKKAKVKKERSSKLTKPKDNRTAEEKIEEKIECLDWDKIKDKKKNKLLIIGCSDTKTQGGNNELVFNFFNNGNYVNLIENRNIRKILQYESLLLNTQNYFENINRGNADYFNFQYNFPLYKSAIDRYYGGKFYSEEHLQLYRQKNDDSNLHILIISGLYGIIEFRDSIIDYHLEIKRQPFWTKDNNTSIHDAVKKYIKENEIANEMVFYSLSNSGNYCYTKALKPSENWNDIWINHDRGDTPARFLKDYFLPEL